LVNSDVKFVKLQANPKVHKSGIPLRTIVNVGNHPTANMAEIVEHELAENVRSIDNELKKVAKLDRNHLLQYKTDKCKTDRVPLVLTYSKDIPHVCEIKKKKMTVLHKSAKMKKKGS
jgi:hypothetical protein